MAKGHTHSVQSVSVCGKIMVTGSSDRTIRVWDLSDNKEVLLLLSLSLSLLLLLSLLLSLSLSLLLSGTASHTVIS